MARLSAELWARIRHEFETTGLSTWDLAKIYNTDEHPITRQAIAKRQKTEGWVKLVDPKTGDPISQWAADKLAGIDPGMSPEQVQERIAVLVDERIEIILQHRAEWKEIKEIRNKALEAFRDETWMPKDADPEKWRYKDRIKAAQELFATYQSAAIGQLQAQEGERRAHSFDYKMQITGAVEASSTNAELERLDQELLAIFTTRAEGDDETVH
jgi:hypothetical protein